MKIARWACLVMGISFTGCGEAPGPKVEGLSPPRVRSGQAITLTGQNFGEAPEKKEVFIGKLNAPVLQWSDRMITVSVPDGLEGDNPVVVKINDVEANPLSVNVEGLPPYAESLSPDKIWPGDVMSVKGKNLGAEKGSVLIGDKMAEVTGWTSEKVDFKIPLDARVAQVIVRTAKGQQAVPLPFRILSPTILALEPTGARPGETILIKGRYFGQGGDGGKVLFKETEAKKIESWNEREIKVQVPPLDGEIGQVPVVVNYRGMSSGPKSLRLPSPPPIGPLIDVPQGAGPYSQILFDDQGWPILLFYHSFSTNVLGLTWDGFQWQKLPELDSPMLHEGLEEGGVRAFGWGIRAFREPSGVIHLTGIMMAEDSVFYGRFEKGNWTMETAIGKPRANSFQSLAIGLDKDNQPVIANFREAGGITIHTRTANGWNEATIDGTGGEGGWAAWVDYARDSKGIGHVTYFDGGKGRLMHAAGTGSQWSVEAVDADGIAGGYAQSAMGPKDELAVSYVSMEKMELRVARNVGGKWSIEKVDQGDKMNSETDVIFDSKGKLHVVYHEGSEKTGGSVRYATNSSGKWATQELAKKMGATSHPKVGVDSGDRAYALFTDGNRRGLVLKIVPEPKGVEKRPMTAEYGAFQWTAKVLSVRDVPPPSGAPGKPAPASPAPQQK